MTQAPTEHQAEILIYAAQEDGDRKPAGRLSSYGYRAPNATTERILLDRGWIAKGQFYQGNQRLKAEARLNEALAKAEALAIGKFGYIQFRENWREIRVLLNEAEEIEAALRHPAYWLTPEGEKVAAEAERKKLKQALDMNRAVG